MFEPVEMKVECYCYSQNCFGDEAGIGCCWCVELAMEKGDPVEEVEPGVCRFGCAICGCSCHATFELEGPQVRFPPFFFRIEKTNGLKFHVTRCFDSRESKSLFTSPPSQWCSTLPPPCTLYPPLARRNQ